MPLNLTPYLQPRSVPSFRTVLLVSTLLRVGLILYSEWHDAHSVVKYTDIDYRVFSDAARFLRSPSADNVAQGPLGKLLNLGEYVLPIDYYARRLIETSVARIRARRIVTHRS